MAEEAAEFTPEWISDGKISPRISTVPSDCPSPHTDDSLKDASKDSSENDLSEKSNSDCSSDNTSESDVPNETIYRNTKKRCHEPSNNDSRKKAKLERNSGIVYVPQSKLKLNVKEKQLRTACTDKCRLHCNDNISETDRQKLFDDFWRIDDLQRQRESIASNIVPIRPKYRYAKTEKPRENNTAFHFVVANKKIRVCKTFFMATLDINARTIRTVVSKMNKEGLVESDLRGKHKNHRVVNAEIKDSVRDFIKAIPRVKPPNLRQQTSREFIEGGRTLLDLYRDYKELRDREDLPYAQPTMFRKIFNQEFNISFFRKNKDQSESDENTNDVEELASGCILCKYVRTYCRKQNSN